MTIRGFTILMCLGLANVAWAQTDEPAETPAEPEGATSLAEARKNRSSIVVGDNLSVDESVKIDTSANVHTVQEGETLWDISQRYWGDAHAWPKLWSYNPELTNPHWIYPQGSIRLRPATPGSDGVLPQTKATEASYAKSALGRGARGIFLRHEGYLDRDALKQIGTLGGSVEDHMLLAPGDRAYVQFKNDIKALPGQELILFRTVPLKEIDAKIEGVLVRISGTAQVVDYDAKKKLARARVTESLEPIERGFLVAPSITRFEFVDETPAKRKIQGKVVASINALELMSEMQVAFVDVGTEQGLAKGNPLIVVRHGDEWRKELITSEANAGAVAPSASDPIRSYPEEQVAELRVIDVRRHSATCVVVQALRPVIVGDLVKTLP